MLLRLLTAPRLAVAALGLCLTILASPSARAQEVWEVFMKTSACSETLRDWMTVASVNPTGLGGSNFYFTARHIRGSSAVRFPRTAAGFTEAHAQADAQRLRGFMASADTATGAKYQRYCCNTWSVWRLSRPGEADKLVTQHGYGTPGPGFVQVAGDLCCEDAAVLAGSTSGCGSLTLSTGAIVIFTEDGPKVLGPTAVQLDGITLPPLSPQPPAKDAIPEPGGGDPGVAWDGQWVGSVAARVRDSAGEVRLVNQDQTLTVKREGMTLVLSNKSGEKATFKLAPDGRHAAGSMTERGMTLNGTLTLSEDGRTLTLESTFTDPRGGVGTLSGRLERSR